MTETGGIFLMSGGYSEMPFLTSCTEANYRRV